ncbi:MAG: hypothetical protein EHM67_10700 [Hyphomicrobiaceae bacterium]|nr:MAG: hypothetical protein EHM67_10700 [Hyphomicrobiaceae bacterium]
MLRLLMVVSGAFEALFGLSALIAPDMLVASLGTEPNASIFLARILGAATLGLGTAALLAHNNLDGKGGLAAAYGLGLYNVLAAGFILWTAVGLGGEALWSAGLVHAAIGALFVYALARRAQAAER